MILESYPSHPHLFLTGCETSGDYPQCFLIKSFSEGISKFTIWSLFFLMNNFSQIVRNWLGRMKILLWILIFLWEWFDQEVLSTVTRGPINSQKQLRMGRMTSWKHSWIWVNFVEFRCVYWLNLQLRNLAELPSIKHVSK